MTRFLSGFRKLYVWQKAHALTLQIYDVTKSFPRSEQYGITSQLRRAASSIEAQIVEGSRMQTMAHRKLFYNRSHGSAAEVDTFLELARDLGYMKKDDYEKVLESVNEVSALVYRLYRSCSK